MNYSVNLLMKQFVTRRQHFIVSKPKFFRRSGQGWSWRQQPA
jgi:hypothetical protein